ncbi:MAG TPA: choice-of-anchor N protein [Clostridia bacterium]|nr:choice-of-anchor N protein [Clostridia bacterium]
MKKYLLPAVLVCVMWLSIGASAEPVLQLYIPGAAYDALSETWAISGASTFDIWAVAYLGNPTTGGVYDVKLAVAYQHGSGTTLSIAPATTGGYGGFTDPDTPVAPTLLQTVTNGAAPKTGDGANLPSHGIYGAGTDWSEYALGDFTAKSSPCADFINAMPSPGSTNCQINAYTVTITGGSSPWIHFDLYDHYVSRQGAYRYVNAPFSHDGESDGGQVPEPATVLLLGSGLLGLAMRLRRAMNT